MRFRGMFTVISCSLILSFIFIQQANAFIFISGNSGIDQPGGMAADSYEKNSLHDYGYSLGIRLFSAYGPLGSLEDSYSIGYNRDFIKLSRATAQSYGIDQAHAGIDRYFFDRGNYFSIGNASIFRLNLLTGVKFGGARFKLSDQYFPAMGNSTLTELQNENRDLQYFKTMYTGVELHTANLVSISYNYELTSIDRDFRFWHSAANATLFVLGAAIPGYIMLNLMSPSKSDQDKVRSEILAGNMSSERVSNYKGRILVMTVFTVAYVAAFQYLWYKYDYDHHNYPFNDPRPLHYNRQALALTFTF